MNRLHRVDTTALVLAVVAVAWVSFWILGVLIMSALGIAPCLLC